MPVWGSLMAYFVLHERINARAALGLALCVAGLGVLVYPVAEKSMEEPIGLLLALVCALGWGGGTVYMKWARIRGDLLAISFWQVVVGVVVLGTGIAYFIWFNIIGRLSTVTASLGSLINPVVGVIGAIILLGDRPTVSD